jgi:hypothetical protein
MPELEKKCSYGGDWQNRGFNGRVELKARFYLQNMGIELGFNGKMQITHILCMQMK